MSLVDDERAYVATYKEIILMFITFSIILFVLYPKDMLKNQILIEDKNYDLSIIYLQNMLKHDPANESLMLLLAEKSLQSGKRDLAYRLLKLLLSSKNNKINKSAHLLSYRLAKEDYYFVNDEASKRKIKKDLTTLFIDIIKNKYYTDRTLDELYQESLFLNLKNYSYSLLKEKTLYHSNNIGLLSDAYYQADALGNERETIHFLHMLQLQDTKNRDKWSLNEYYYLIKKHEYAAAEVLLKENSKNSSMWGEQLAEFYLARKNYTGASNIYMQLFNKSKESSDKQLYFIKALKALQAGNYLKEASALGYQYESSFFNVPAIRIFLLKLYLATGDLQKAHHLSKKILIDEIK